MSSLKNKAFQNREPFLRLNFLYQAMNHLVKDPNNIELIRFYSKSMMEIAKKHVLKIDPSIKRYLCKKCFMLLKPGITAKVRHRNKKNQKRLVVRCLDCNTAKRFNTNNNYLLWTEEYEIMKEKEELNKLPENEKI